MSNNAPIMPNPVLSDAAIAYLQQIFSANLPWLDAAFGRAQRLTKMVNGKKIITPNVYCGGWNGHGENDYIETSPDSKIGNFCFFEVEEPELVDWDFGKVMDLTTNFSIIFWFDCRRIFGEADNRNIGQIKNEILTLLNGRSGMLLPPFFRIRINKIFERAENIYRGYTLSEIDNQYLMHPFAGLRFDGELNISQPCGDVEDFVRLYNTDDATIGPEDVAVGKIAYGANGRIIGERSDNYGAIISAQERYHPYVVVRPLNPAHRYTLVHGFPQSIGVVLQESIQLYSGAAYIAGSYMDVQQQIDAGFDKIVCLINYDNRDNVYMIDDVTGEYVFRGSEL